MTARIALVSIMREEIDYVDRWVAGIRRVSGVFCETVVVDGGLDGTGDRLREYGICVVNRPFRGHFADQRNFAVEQCTADWIFELDADEIASQPLIGGLPAIVEDANRAGVDCVGVARLNFIDDVLVASPGYRGLDYQYRLHSRRCHWRGAVHEEVTGYHARYELKLDDGQFIIHSKTSQRHADRNRYYETLTR